MEKIKEFLNPGKPAEDEILYGSGKSSDPVHSGLSGEGSHLAAATDDGTGTTATGTGSSSTGNTYTGGEGSHFAKARDTTIGTTGTTGLGTSSAHGGYGSSGYSNTGSGSSAMPGAFPGQEETQNPYTSREADPRLGGSASDSRSTGTDSTGLTGTSATGTTGSDHHYGRDAAAVGGAAAVGEGVHHHRENERGVANVGNKGYSGATAGTTTQTTTTAGPHDSNLSNKLDPRVDSDHSKTTGASGLTGAGTSATTASTGPATTGTAGSDHHYGRDAAAVGGAAAVGEGIHHRRENERGVGNVGNTGYSGITSGAATGTTTTSGPHDSNVLNKLDPRVDSDNSKTTGASGLTGTGTTTATGRSTTGTAGADHHYGRDAAALGGAAAVGEGVHHHRENERGVGSTGTTAPYSGTTPSGTSSSYYGAPSGTSASGTTSSGTATGTTTTSGPHNSNLLNKLDPRVDSDNSKTTGTSGTTGTDHHYSRDAAVAGGVAAAGEGIHHHRENERGLGNTSTTGTTAGSYSGTTPSGTGSSYYGGPAGTAVSTGPHQIPVANLLDPHVNQSSIPAESGSTVGSSTTGHHYGRDATVGAAGLAGAGALGRHEHEKNTAQGTPVVDQYGSQRTTTGITSGNTTSGHHYGRDAAGVGGAAALAEHEHHKHDKDLTAAEREEKREHKHAEKEAKREAKEEKREHKHAEEEAKHAAKDEKHHYGRDAAIGGAGIAGAGALGKHEHDKTQASRTPIADQFTSQRSTFAADPNTNTSGPHNSNLLNKLDPRVDSDNSKTTGTSGTTGTDHHYSRDAAGVGGAAALAEHEHRTHDDTTHSQTAGTTTSGHHYGRDAAGVGGAGAVAEHEHHKHDKDLTAAEKEAKREHKHEEKELKREAKEDKKSHGLFGFLHRDKNKKYSKEEEAEFERQERESHSHKGRDAALGGAAVGGAYEAEKHHGNNNDVNKPLPTAPGNQGIGTGEGTQNALADRTRATGTHEMGQLPGQSTTSTNDHHHGRDAAAVGGVGAGAAALGAHEHRKHDIGVEVPRGNDYGKYVADPRYHNPSTGVAGVPAASGGVGIKGSGLDASNTPGYGQAPPEVTEPPGTTLGDHLHGVPRNRGVGHETSEGYTATGTDSHLGRDAAVGAGGVGLAEHEHSKHHIGATSGTTGTGSHLGRDAALGAGGVGLAEHEHNKHYTGATTGTTGTTGEYGTSSAGSDTTTGSAIGSNVTNTSTGRNLLHKDPPASHPAAQAARGLDDNAGVSNAHGSNPPANY